MLATNASFLKHVISEHVLARSIGDDGSVSAPTIRASHRGQQLNPLEPLKFQIGSKASLSAKTFAFLAKNRLGPLPRSITTPLSEKLSRLVKKTLIRVLKISENPPMT